MTIIKVEKLTKVDSNSKNSLRAKYLDYAKLSDLVYKPEQTIRDEISASSYYNTVGVIDDALTGTFVIAVWDDSAKQLVFVFRGTNETADWASNLRAWLVKRPGLPGKVHKGFYEAVPFAKLDAIIRGFRAPDNNGDDDIIYVTTTGHSLGGALATLYACHVRTTWPNTCKSRCVDAVTFGAPKVGNRAFAKEFNKTVDCTRFIHSNDIVPHLPWFLGIFYKNVGMGVLLDEGSFYFTDSISLAFKIIALVRALWNMNSFIADHDMGKYVDEFKARPYYS